MHWVNANVIVDLIENIGLTFQFQSSFSISVSFTLILKLDNNFNSTYHCVTIEYDVLHQSESYIKCLTCINVFWSVYETGGLKIEFEIGISIMCFRGRPPIAL